ncbi:MAG: hypothetical protein ACLPX5_07435 [Dissulfurispiraceae bacterium]
MAATTLDASAKKTVPKSHDQERIARIERPEVLAPAHTFLGLFRHCKSYLNVLDILSGLKADDSVGKQQQQAH